MITHERLKELVNYDPETGSFTWAFGRPGASKDGRCGSPNKGNGYIEITLDRKSYTAHRLAYHYMTGDAPENEIDHINHVTHDNRWVNLRPVTRKENGRNRSLNKNNKSGCCGVSWMKSAGKWYAGIEVNGIAINLGLYDDLEDAISARHKANNKYGFHKNHGKDN
jgi:hypothetical protein